MEYFTKLDASISDSSIWVEDHETFRVWIYLLSRANQTGVVDVSLPGVASVCRITLAKCEEAFAKFQAPDPYSRNKDMDGRRLVHLENGRYQLVTYEQRRNTSAREESRKKTAERVRRCREKKRSVLGGVTSCNDFSSVSLSISTSSSDLISDPDHTGRGVQGGRAPTPPTRTAIPDDWQPAQATIDAMAMAGVSDPAGQVSVFVAHCQAEGLSSASWEAAFRKWCLRARNWAQERVSRQGGGKGTLDAKRSQRGDTGQTQTEGSIRAANLSYIRAKVNTHLKILYGRPYPADIDEQITLHSNRLEAEGWDAEGQPPGLPVIDWENC